MPSGRACTRFPDAAIAGRRSGLRRPANRPEPPGRHRIGALVTGRERAYLGWFYREFSWRRGAIDASAVDEYLRTYTQPGALRAGFAYYRNLPRDAADNAALLATGFRLPMPVLALGGARTGSRGRAAEPEESMRRVAHDVTGFVVADSGHFVPEEQPEVVARHILEHVARHG